MSLRSELVCPVLAGLLVAGQPAIVSAQQTTAKAPAPSKAQQVIDQAAQEDKYAFLLFYRQNDEATKGMSAILKDGLAKKSEQAVVTSVQVGDPAEAALVAKYDVSRAPLPMIVAHAPNGAMTGIFSQRVTTEKIGEAFVTPTMMFAMKNLQENKLVLVTVQGSAKAAAPVAIKDFQSDPHFKDRIVTVGITAADPLEAKFLGQMQIDPKAKATHTVLLAPPGVMVGKFDAVASKDEIAAVLAKAGKCCDDPNCKHHHGATQQATQPTNTRRK